MTKTQTLKNYMIFFNCVYGDIESDITSKVCITAYNEKEAIDIFIEWLQVSNRNAKIVNCKKVTIDKRYIEGRFGGIEERYTDQYLILTKLKAENEKKGK